MTEQTALEKTRDREMTAKQKKVTTLADLLNDPVNKAKIDAGAPKYLNTDALIRVALTAVQKNEGLLKCSAGSILQACMDCATYGLTPNSATNEAHLVPFKDSCVLVVGYKGLIKLATNSGLVSGVRVRKVYTKDVFLCEMGLDEKLVHKPNLGDRGDFIGAYAVVVFTDGSKDFTYVSLEQGLAHGKKYSRAFAKSLSPWQTDPESMVCKTAVRMVLKYVPASPESERLSIAIMRDEKQDMSGIIDLTPENQKEEIAAPKPLAKAPDNETPPDNIDPDTGEVIPDEILHS